MDPNTELRHAIGMADLCELLTSAFNFPTQDLAKALSDGTFASDWNDAIEDAGSGCKNVSVLCAPMKPCIPEAELPSMRREYSRMYLSPGTDVLIWPYETAFLHVERNLGGTISLFRTPVTMDVERQMREAGVAAKNSRTEPVDSMFQEFEFLAFLYASLAQSLFDGPDCMDRGKDADAEIWRKRIRIFAETHMLVWMPSFMERTGDLTENPAYRKLSEAALAFLELLDEDVRTFRSIAERIGE